MAALAIFLKIFPDLVDEELEADEFALDLDPITMPESTDEVLERRDRKCLCCSGTTGLVHSAGEASLSG